MTSEIPRANNSTLSRTSIAEYRLFDRPHVKGGLDSRKGQRPCLFSSMKSAIEKLVGGSYGSSGTHEGGLKTILLVLGRSTVDRSNTPNLLHIQRPLVMIQIWYCEFLLGASVLRHLPV